MTAFPGAAKGLARATMLPTPATGVAMNNHLDVVRSLYQAFAAGDIAAVLGALAADVHWTEAAGGPYAGVSIGPDAVLANVFARIAADWDGYAVVPGEFVAQGSTVVALGEYSGTCKASGKFFTAAFAHVWKFDDGRIVSFQQHTDTALILLAMRTAGRGGPR